MAKKNTAHDDIASSVRSSFPSGFVMPAVASKHPTASGMSREARKDVFNLDPHRITEVGFYVREADIEDEDFDAFCTAVKERGQIDQSISVRTTGPVANRQYILVWGMRRLRAALRLGIEQVPVRDFGEISETEAIKLQLQENLNRKPMSPLETAIAFSELASRGERNTAIARLFGKTASYVSYMLKTGEALARLEPAERRTLNANGALRVRDCQRLALIDDLAARTAALRTLLTTPASAPASDAAETPDAHADDPHGAGNRSAAEPAPADGGARRAAPAITRERRPDEDAPFVVRELRNGQGRSFRVRWRNRDLVENPEHFVEQFTALLRTEVEHLVGRLESLKASHAEHGGSLGRDMADEFERARQAALKHAAWLSAPVRVPTAAGHQTGKSAPEEGTAPRPRRPLAKATGR